MQNIVVPDIKDKEYKGLKPISEDEAIVMGLQMIDDERKGNQLGLYTRWQSLNIIQGKYFRFPDVNLFASLSSHGKSFIFNMMKQDFSELFDITNREGIVIKTGLNSNFKEKCIILYFGFEQDAINEIIRTLSGVTGKSFTELKSSKFDDNLQRFIDLSDEDYHFTVNQSKIVANRPVFYFNDRASCTTVFNTYEAFRKVNPDAKIAVFIDHGFLFHKKQSMNDGDLVQEVGNLCISLKKKGAMVNMLWQMNQNIKSVDRLTKPDLHHPMDSDIYFGSQVFWACDNVYIFPYQPALLNLKTYSNYKLKTSLKTEDGYHNLIVCSKIKSRNGIIAERYFKSDFGRGKIIPAKMIDFTNNEELINIQID